MDVVAAEIIDAADGDVDNDVDDDEAATYDTGIGFDERRFMVVASGDADDDE